jgi:molybdopterin converting factor small subunit
MRVRVTLNASLRRYAPGDGSGNVAELELPAGANVAAVAAALAIPAGRAAMAVLDGAQVTADTVLADGAELGLFPPLAGG